MLAARAAVVVAAVVAAGLLAACNERAAPGGHVASARSGQSGSAPHVEISPADGGTDVPLNATLHVTVARGTLQSVTVTSKGPDGRSGAETGGVLQDTWWQRQIPLGQGTTYTIDVKAGDETGRTVERRSTFSTIKPAGALSANVSPVEGETVGVGMPIVLRLTAPVVDKVGFEQHVRVASDHPVDGAWHWFSDKEVHFRPRDYWPANSNVTVSAGLSGFDAGNGVWGVSNQEIHFKIGPAQVSTVDTRTHQMTVTSDGQVVRTVPVSTGRDKYPTKSGVHVISEKAQMVIMDSATVGIPRNSPDGYYEKVFWNVRISNSGEFVHAAPWSVGSQGRANVSHGCVNVSTANAQWFYGFSRRGDVVNVVGSPERLEPTNGLGDWNVPWEQWANATKAIAAAPVIPESGPSR